jgi:pSer/pThr/pTyr-binding forkhead associated (FHA) protein
MQMFIDKDEIKDVFLPKAVLVAQTNEASAAIPIKSRHDGMIPIWKFPFRIGRESRIEIDEYGHIFVKERYKHGVIGKMNNDIYLIDFGERLQISREHLRIDKEDGRYYLIDRGSKCGSAVNDERIGNDSPKERTELKDGDTIVLGTDASPYRYTFIVL